MCCTISDFYKVSYVPQMIGNHNIYITFNDEPLQGKTVPELLAAKLL